LQKLDDLKAKQGFRIFQSKEAKKLSREIHVAREDLEGYKQSLDGHIASRDKTIKEHKAEIKNGQQIWLNLH
jgi:phage-related minor tail protein